METTPGPATTGALEDGEVALDAALSRFRQASDLIRTNLVDLERDPHRALLDAAPLTGLTAARWAEATQTWAELWRAFSSLDALLERAQAERGRRHRIPPLRRAALAALLTGPSIELDRRDVPVGERGLLGAPQTMTTCTPDQLLARMSDQYRLVSGLVSAIGARWDALAPRVGHARTVWAAATANARELGESADPELEAVQALIERLADGLARDPLSAAPDDFDGLDRRLAAVGQAVAAAVAFRREVEDRIRDARATFDDLTVAIAAAQDAHAAVLVKIAGVSVPDPPRPDRPIHDELEHVIALSRTSRWRAARAALEAWNDHARRALERAQDCTAACRRPIEHRNELRGRLDAYAAMAGQHGRAEDPALADRYRRAVDALYTAPTDLQQAAELVRSYQDLLQVRRQPIEGRCGGLP
jgi:hypothetical protein